MPTSPPSRWRFESCVVLDGDKTAHTMLTRSATFESCVVLDGDKTRLDLARRRAQFESCVVLDGDKTYCASKHDAL